MMRENICVCLLNREECSIVLKNCLESILRNDLEIKMRKKIRN